MQLIIKHLGLQDYEQTFTAMRDFTDQRHAATSDELWIVEHPPVYTLGLNGKKEHLLDTGDIPVVATDRGGQITYHGPGQLVIYVLLDLKRLNIGIRKVVTALEQAMIETLSQYGIKAHAKPEAPGVYVDRKKIGSVGLRVRKGSCYHGLSLNNRLDLQPFSGINPCGYPGLEVTQLADFDVIIDTHELAIPVANAISKQLS